MTNVLSYFFFTLLCISSLCVVLLQNTFFALLFLILSFLLTAIILFFLECEFLALLLIIIYVGAVAVLLLFVLMMLETKLKNLSKDIILYFPFGVFINGVFFFNVKISHRTQRPGNPDQDIDPGDQDQGSGNDELEHSSSGIVTYYGSNQQKIITNIRKVIIRHQMHQLFVDPVIFYRGMNSNLCYRL